MHLSVRVAMKCVVAGLAATTSTALAYASPSFASTPAPTSTPQSITTLAGNGTSGYSGDGGPAVLAELSAPTGISEDLTGSLYIGDTANNRVRKVVNPTSIHTDVITTLAGNGTKGFAGDGGPATSAKLNSPTGTAVDSHGDVFIADTGNNRVREVLPNGIIQTVAGNGSCTKNMDGDRGPALSASLCSPTGVAVGSNGNLYIADTGHDQVRLVSNGTITGYVGEVGKCGRGGDGGPAGNAQLCLPTGLALDATGALYIADTSNARIQEVAPGTTTVSTVAGNGHSGYGGDGGPATSAMLNSPTGVAVNSLGDLFISDTLNNRIRQVHGGTISTYAGTGTQGFSGDGGPATSAELSSPTGSMAVDGTALYFSDTGNNRVRGIFNGPPPVLPESPLAILLPVSAALLLAGGGGAFWLRRRRHATPAAT